MTKIPSYDELEIDERPRVCGGAVFQKFMRKAKRCASPEKNGVPVLTSSSSFSSSQASSTSLNNMYDPSKTHFCMPRQIDGVGATMATESDKDCSKLNFQLQLEEHDIDGVGLHGEDRIESNNIIQLNPQVVNDLKTKHMQSLEEKKLSGNSKRESGDPGTDSAFELAMCLRKDSEKTFAFEESVRTPRSGFLMDDTDEVNENADIDAVWDDLQHTRTNPSTNREQKPYVSKASILRREMTSFREELNAVKKSLPNQFQTNVFNETDIEGGKLSNQGSNSHPSKLHHAVKPPQNQIESNQNVNHDVAWNVTSFWSNAAKNAAKTAAKSSSKKQVQEVTNNDKKYFKNNWNLEFQDQEYIEKKTESMISTPTKKQSDGTVSDVTQDSKKPSSIGGTDEKFPECPEMPIGQTSLLSQDEKENSEIKSAEETHCKVRSDTCDERQDYIALSSKARLESGNLQDQNLIDPSRHSDKRESAEDERASTKSNYQKDMELVQLLLRKYGKEIDEKQRDEKVNRIRAVVDVPTDAWFHRHATGMRKNSNKLSISKVDETCDLPHRNSIMKGPSLTEQAEQRHGNSPELLSKEKNRVQIKNSNMDRVINDSEKKQLRSMAGNKSPRMSAKIQFWEGTKL